MKLPACLALSALFFAACSHPGSFSGDRKANLVIPKRYDATPAPSPEVSAGLLSLFNDAKLRGLVNQALKFNPDLRVSAARLDEAGYNLGASKAGLSPTLNASSSASRRQFANLGFGGGSGAIPPNNSFDASLDAAWEPDVWGRIRAGISAAAANQQAAAADYESARQSIAAQVMQAYMNLAGASEQLQLSRTRLSSFQDTFELVERRFEAGTSELSDLQLAKTDWENSKSEVAQRENTRDQAARQLKLLTGAYPDASLTATLPSMSRSVPSGIPSTLLMRRPDIDAAYQRLRAADEQVTVAHRALFPSFNLTATGGRSSPTLEQLSESGFNTWTILAGLSAPLIDGGRRRSELGASFKRAEQAYYSYQQTVLSAFGEVEDALGSERALARQVTATEAALKAARLAEDRTRRNYEAGLVEILTLLDAQRRRFAAQDALISLQTLRRQNRISLSLSLAKGI